MIPLPIYLIGGVFNPILFGKWYIVYGLLIYIAVCWIVYVNRIINEICAVLNIQLFRIPHVKGDN